MESELFAIDILWALVLDSYDVTVRIEIPSKNIDDAKVDLVKVRIFPSCDSGKINKQKCNHGFKIEILDYKHLSQ
ncbi:hypothetical protein AM499_05120 [Bacillus sp. FJAT-22090]|uniref:hypothetical protein n=1 Tax=Bacillus sp. FJAT-22090 TaxID=1581038 RepID=UPI0006AE2979|nr:hypothetical protein [Bacillus sp. FJAT-22090]ALC85265.1 hypothetical protein AM499_05120 [Bacillus sp. FJAT-22090]